MAKKKTQEVQEVSNAQEVQKVAFVPYMERHSAEAKVLSDLKGHYPQKVEQLEPTLLIEATSWDARAQGVPTADFLREILAGEWTAEGYPVKERHKEIIEFVEQWQELIKNRETNDKTAESALTHVVVPVEKIDLMLDKPNTYLWDFIAGADANGQLYFDVSFNNANSEMKKKEVEALIFYSIDFSELEGLAISKELTPFDKLVYIVVGALFNAGNDVVSATQIYKIMGNNGNPGASDLKDINDSLTKMGAAKVTIDNKQEVEAYADYEQGKKGRHKKDGYKHFKYDASLLPFERCSAYINDQFTDSAIHIFREPPLISFARGRNQLTTFSQKLLESPVSKTEANLRLQDYLLTHIGRIKAGTAKNKMLYSTIFERCQITDKKQKQRAPEKIERYLRHYVAEGWISGYKMDPDGVVIKLTADKKKLPGKTK